MLDPRRSLLRYAAAAIKKVWGSCLAGFYATRWARKECSKQCPPHFWTSRATGEGTNYLDARESDFSKTCQAVMGTAMLHVPLACPLAQANPDSVVGRFATGNVPTSCNFQSFRVWSAKSATWSHHVTQTGEPNHPWPQMETLYNRPSRQKPSTLMIVSIVLKLWRISSRLPGKRDCIRVK